MRLESFVPNPGSILFKKSIFEKPFLPTILGSIEKNVNSTQLKAGVPTLVTCLLLE
jgi:hypothetical protein